MTQPVSNLRCGSPQPTFSSTLQTESPPFPRPLSIGETDSLTSPDRIRPAAWTPEVHATHELAHSEHFAEQAQPRHEELERYEQIRQLFPHGEFSGKANSHLQRFFHSHPRKCHQATLHVILASSAPCKRRALVEILPVSCPCLPALSNYLLILETLPDAEITNDRLKACQRAYENWKSPAEQARRLAGHLLRLPQSQRGQCLDLLLRPETNDAAFAHLLSILTNLANESQVAHLMEEIYKRAELPENSTCLEVLAGVMKTSCKERQQKILDAFLHAENAVEAFISIEGGFALIHSQEFRNFKSWGLPLDMSRPLIEELSLEASLRNDSSSIPRWPDCMDSLLSALPREAMDSLLSAPAHEAVAELLSLYMRTFEAGAATNFLSRLGAGSHFLVPETSINGVGTPNRANMDSKQGFMSQNRKWEQPPKPPILSHPGEYLASSLSTWQEFWLFRRTGTPPSQPPTGEVDAWFLHTPKKILRPVMDWIAPLLPDLSYDLAAQLIREMAPVVASPDWARKQEQIRQFLCHRYFKERLPLVPALYHPYNRPLADLIESTVHDAKIDLEGLGRIPVPQRRELMEALSACVSSSTDTTLMQEIWRLLKFRYLGRPDSLSPWLLGDPGNLRALLEHTASLGQDWSEEYLMGWPGQHKCPVMIALRLQSPRHRHGALKDLKIYAPIEESFKRLILQELCRLVVSKELKLPCPPETWLDEVTSGDRDPRPEDILFIGSSK